MAGLAVSVGGQPLHEGTLVAARELHLDVSLPRGAGAALAGSADGGGAASVWEERVRPWLAVPTSCCGGGGVCVCVCVCVCIMCVSVDHVLRCPPAAAVWVCECV